MSSKELLDTLWNVAFAIFVVSGFSLVVLAVLIHKVVWGTWL